jgi:hypothetical protein
VALIVASAIMIFMFLPSRWTPYLLAVGLFFGLVMCFTFGDRLLDMSARQRVVFWGYGNMAFKSNPIFGIGYNMYWLIADGLPAHNAFVTCYTELGVFGYWMWFSLIFMGVLGSWRVRLAMATPQTTEQAYLFRFAGVGIAALGGFCSSAYFLSKTFVFPMFFMIAIVNAVPRIAELMLDDDSKKLLDVKSDLFKWGTVVTLGSIAYIYVSIILLNKAYGG